MTKTRGLEWMFFNGVHADTGLYGLGPMTGSELADAVVHGRIDETLYDATLRRELAWRHSRMGRRHCGVKEGVDIDRLDQAGWGAIFASNAEPAVCEALAPLLELRREQAGELFELYEGEDGFRVGEDTKASFLRRHKLGPGPVDPAKVPYHLLLVGDPETIPFRFQWQLDVQHGVGRLDLGADPEAYARYAESVVASETGRGAGRREGARRLRLFGVANPDDAATAYSSRYLVAPLREHLERTHPDWEVSAVLAEEATKARLLDLLGGDEAPDFLLAAGHGLEFSSGDPRQASRQGAILCQDWPGPKAWRRRIPRAHYVAGDDLTSDADLSGLVAFFFVCYGGGTPRLDHFSRQIAARQEEARGRVERRVLAPGAFSAALPQRMLSSPGGAALAVVAHVERAWGCSFAWSGMGSQTTVFESAMDRLLDGRTVGAAFEYFDERYAELSTTLTDELDEIEWGKQVDPYELACLWTANNDARGYMVFGDPAVRLPLCDNGASP